MIAGRKKGRSEIAALLSLLLISGVFLASIVPVASGLPGEDQL